MSLKRLLRLPEVLAAVGFSESKLYRMITANDFPKPIRIGASSHWVESEINDWVESQMAIRDAA